MSLTATGQNGGTECVTSTKGRPGLGNDQDDQSAGCTSETICQIPTVPEKASTNTTSCQVTTGTAKALTTARPPAAKRKRKTQYETPADLRSPDVLTLQGADDNENNSMDKPIWFPYWDKLTSVINSLLIPLKERLGRIEEELKKVTNVSVMPLDKRPPPLDTRLNSATSGTTPHAEAMIRPSQDAMLGENLQEINREYIREPVIMTHVVAQHSRGSNIYPLNTNMPLQDLVTINLPPASCPYVAVLVNDPPLKPGARETTECLKNKVVHWHSSKHIFPRSRAHEILFTNRVGWIGPLEKKTLVVVV